jgi:hypothetical protein
MTLELLDSDCLNWTLKVSIYLDCLIDNTIFHALTIVS